MPGSCRTEQGLLVLIGDGYLYAADPQGNLLCSVDLDDENIYGTLSANEVQILPLKPETLTDPVGGR